MQMWESLFDLYQQEYYEECFFEKLDEFWNIIYYCIEFVQFDNVQWYLVFQEDGSGYGSYDEYIQVFGQIKEVEVYI